ncbi:MAG: alpha/beta fold hydrolase [Coleofasciculaceae cyanobacterium RL_1_1]|nr:alpha/beta fold hydrolase [Coleofasciculaceae cyanobacterium RL_1_1]
MPNVTASIPSTSFSRPYTQRDWVWRGWRIRYAFTGNVPQHNHRPPIVCIHGFGAAIGHWRQNLPVWAQTHRCYAVDLPGFGASQKAYAPYTMALWAEMVGDFLREIVGQAAIVVGHSIGSLVSLATVDQCPDWVRGVVLVTLPDPSLRTRAIPKPLRGVIAAIEGSVGQRWLLRPILAFLRDPKRLTSVAKLAYTNPEAVTPELVAVFSKPAYDRDAVRALTALVRQASKPDYCPDLVAILERSRLPILLVWGRDDRLVPPSLARPASFAQYSDRLTLHEIAPAGHCPHDECPEVFNALILRWIEAQGLNHSA